MKASAEHYAAGRFAAAEAATREAIRLAPHVAGAWANLGAILRAQRRTAEALEALDAGLVVSPSDVSLRLNRANVLNDLQRWPEALDAATHTLAAAPGNAFAHTARGNALIGLGRRSEAIEAFQDCLRLEPRNTTARYNLAMALVETGAVESVVELYDVAAIAMPGSAKTHLDRGHLLASLKRWAQAAESFDRAHALDPRLPMLAGQRLYTRMNICDWRDFDALVQDLARRIDAGERAALPFNTVAAPLSRARQLYCATTYSTQAFTSLPRPALGAPQSRIRIGYFSADFHDHATAYLFAEALELHDRAAFEVTAFSFSPDKKTPVRRRLEAACEHFIDVNALEPAAIARMSVQRQIDIAVDLKGYTADARPRIFAAGAAPVQVSYLGFPMSTGAPFMDYLIADRTLIAAQEFADYSEKVAWLPGCYQPNDRQRPPAIRTTTRADHGLAADAFVFASFNGSYKITPQIFAVWMELLRETPESVLWLLRDDAAASRNLRASAEAAGIAPHRLVFAPYVTQQHHLERIGHADLFLDSLPCCAHTTASDALWAGLPLLTCRGETFAGRVAASLLAAANLPELIVENLADYKATALALARDPERLTALRSRVQEAKRSPLYDTPSYVRGLEDLYRRMHTRRLAGLPPDHLP